MQAPRSTVGSRLVSHLLRNGGFVGLVRREDSLRAGHNQLALVCVLKGRKIGMEERTACSGGRRIQGDWIHRGQGKNIINGRKAFNGEELSTLASEPSLLLA